MMNTKATLIQKYCRGYLAQRQIITAKNSFKISLNLQQLEDSVKHRKLKIATDLQVKLAYLWRRKLREKMRLLEQQLAARERERAQILAKQIQTKKKVKRPEPEIAKLTPPVPELQSQVSIDTPTSSTVRRKGLSMGTKSVSERSSVVIARSSKAPIAEQALKKNKTLLA